MARIPLGELRLDEWTRMAVEHILAEAPLKLGEELLVAEDEPRIEQSRANGHVGERQPHALIDGARGMADLKAEIPQNIEHVLGDALAPGGLLVRKQKEEVDVGSRREKPTP